MIGERTGPHAVIWSAMLAAPFLYGGIVLFALPARPVAPDPVLPLVLLVLGVVQALAAQVLWAQIRRGAFAGKTAASGAPLPMPIVVWALDESAGVIGLVIAFLGAPPAWSLALLGVAVVALLLNPWWVLEEDA